MAAAKKVDAFLNEKILSAKEIHSNEHRIKREDLKPAERGAIVHYTGDAYIDMNGILRNYEEWLENTESSIRDSIADDDYYDDMSEEDIDEYVANELSDKEAFANEYIQELTDVFDRVRTTENMRTYRGLASDYMADIKDTLKVGDTLQDDGFVSTSTDEEVSQRFGSYIMEVLIPKGSKAMSVKHLSSVSDEDEVLLDAGAKFEVCEINHEKKRLVVMLSH